MTTSPSSPTMLVSAFASRRRGCLFYLRRGLKWLGISLLALVLLGVSLQALASELDKRNFSPRGQLYTVNGHQMHMICVGEGSPTVVLDAGGGDWSLVMLPLQQRLAEFTQTCVLRRGRERLERRGSSSCDRAAESR